VNLEETMLHDKHAPGGQAQGIVRRDIAFVAVTTEAHRHNALLITLPVFGLAILFADRMKSQQ
jgi:hypothetical protein